MNNSNILTVSDESTEKYNSQYVRTTYLITTKNRARYLEKTLQNVREFIEANDELIVIDGKSSDCTQDVIERNRDIVTLFLSEQDVSEGNALNKGLFRSRGRYIKPITDDDYFYPESMRYLINVMETNPNIEAIQCGGEVWNAQTDTPVFVGYRFLPEGITPTGEAIFTSASIGLGLILRRSVIEKIGGVSSNYVSVDGDLACKLIECKCVFRYLDINLYRWYVRDHSGFNRQKEFSRERIIFDIRLNRWEAAVEQILNVAEAQDVKSQPLIYWIKIASLFYRSPIGNFSPALLRVMESVSRSIRRVTVAHKRSHDVGDQTDSTPKKCWSGRLF